MMRHYLSDRVLIYDITNGPAEKKITAGAAQGSILGPDLWNASYDGILRIEMPSGTCLVALADEIAAVIEARKQEEAQLKLNQVMIRVNGWMENHGLKLAIKKTEILIMTIKRITTVVPVKVGTETINTKEAVRHLGIKLDGKLNFREHMGRGG